jgi:methylmalonyl-CoA mutase
VAKVNAEREKNVANREESIIGTSDFPFLAEETVTVLQPPPPPSGEMPATSFPPLPRRRVAGPFEALHDRSDAYLAAHGQRPKVLLVCLGRASDYTARASFAKSLFEAGGIEAVEGHAPNFVEGFRESGAELACLCSSDKVYATEAENAAKTLIQAGAKHVYLAGKSKDAEILKAAGVDAFLYAGCDALALLTEAYANLEGE